MLSRPTGGWIPPRGIRDLLEGVRADELSCEVRGIVNHRGQRDVAVVLLPRDQREVFREDRALAVRDAVLADIAGLHVRRRDPELSTASRALHAVDRNEARAARVDERAAVHLPSPRGITLPRGLAGRGRASRSPRAC